MPQRRAIDIKIDKDIVEHKATLVRLKALRETNGRLDHGNETIEEEARIKLETLEELKGA